MRLVKISLVLCAVITFFWSCQKEYSLEGANIKLPAGSWQFNDSSKLFRGNMDTAYIDSSQATKTLNLIGSSLAGTEFFAIQLYSIDSFKVRTYTASLGESAFRYFNAAKTIYQADQITGDVIVNVTALGNNHITGTFTALALDSLSNLKIITLGKFTSSIKLSGAAGSGAAGTLGATAGACTPATLAGTYTQGVALTAANTATIQVNVTSPGTYAISTNGVNGVTFSNSGTFTTTGLKTVILNGSGTPVNSGNQNYTVSFGASNCTFTVNYVAGAGAATGTLGVTAGSCTPFTPAGTYTQGTALNASNTVTVQVTVLTIGTYNITTNTVNGVSFSKAGSFTMTGVQPVILTGTGTPVGSGVQNFTVTFNTSTCNFPLTFAPVIVPNTDYFPLTANSYWTYDDTAYPPDTTYRLNSSQVMIAGNNYRSQVNGAGPVGVIGADSLPYRKSGNDYYEYINVDTFAFGTFDTPQYADVLFLKENSTVGATWTSATFSGLQGGIAYQIKYNFTIAATNATMVVNGKTYINVIQVNWKSQESIMGSPFTDENLYESYYAKGIGLIQRKETQSGGTPTFQYLRSYQVF